MTDTAPSVAIIGAGTAGTGAARRALELGARDVTMIEATGPAAGSSGRSAAIYNVQTVDPLHLEVRTRAREIFFELERTRGLPLTRIGNVRVAWTERDLETLAHVITVQRGLGLTDEDSVLLDRAELQRLVPDLETSDLAGGLFGPRDGVIDGGFLCRTLLDDARAAGMRYLRGKVVGHDRTAGGQHRLTTSAGDQVVADVVVNAAGAWAGKVGAILGVDVPVAPQVHDIVKVRLAQKLPYTVPMVNLYMPGSEGEALYFRQFDDMTLLAGFHTYVVLDDHPIADPDDYRSTVLDSYREEVSAAIGQRLKVAGMTVEPGWTGLYPLSPDGEFIVGPESADPTLITCTGLGGVGVTSGTIAGYTASEWAISGEPTTVPTATAWTPTRSTLRERKAL